MTRPAAALQGLAGGLTTRVGERGAFISVLLTPAESFTKFGDRAGTSTFHRSGSFVHETLAEVGVAETAEIRQTTLWTDRHGGTGLGQLG